MDGTEVPTMSAGKPNTATLSADGKTLTVEDTIASGRVKVTEIWTKK